MVKRLFQRDCWNKLAMKGSLLRFALAGMAALWLSGCSRAPEQAVKSLFQPSPDKDVTASPDLNFSPFAGTVWKTRTKVAVADLKRYTGAHQASLLPPDSFDPTDPKYSRIPDMKMIAVLPPGARLRITRLLKDQGAWGGLQVEAVLSDGTNTEKVLYLDPSFLAGNAWTRGPSSNTNWTGNPELLEKVETP
jgi:hypothetical protein